MSTVPKTERASTTTLSVGSAGPFLLGFRLFDDDTIEVYVDQVRRYDWTLTAAYTNGYSDSAYITFDASVSSGSELTIYGALEPWREEDLINGDRNLVQNLNVELGRVWSAISELKSKAGRAIRTFSPQDPLQDTTDAVVGYDAIGGLTAYPMSSLLAQSILAAGDLSDVVAGVGLPRTAPNAAMLASVLVNGQVAIMDGLAYLKDSSATGSASATNDLSVDGLVPHEVASLGHFGAAVDGATDDSAAILAALTWAKANDTALSVPGIARLASAVTLSMAAEQHISLIGIGPRNSGFLVDNVTGGIDFDGSTVRSHSVSLQNLGFFPNSDGAGYPFKIRGLEGGSQDNRAAEVANVHVGPVDDTVAYSFSAGPSVTGLFRPYFSNLIVMQGSASTTKMAHIMDISGSYKPAWGGECYLKATAAGGGADYGLIQSGDTPEDMTCLPITINGADIGWLIQNTGREPGGLIVGHHINSKMKNIVVDGLKYATILAPQLYADTTALTFIDIELINADGVQILDPIFRGNLVNDRRHVKADPTAPDVVRNIKVRAFGLYATVTVAPFYIGAEVDNVQIELPHYVSGSDFASYPSELVEVAIGAQNVIVKTPTETRTYDDGATTGPLMRYVRRSTSPAASDVLAEHDFVGMDSGGAEAVYAAIRAIIRDATNGSEDGALQFYAMIAGTSTQAVSLEAPGTNQTAMFLLVDDGGVVSLKRVKKGADDSGGTGLSALVIDN